MFSVLVLPLKKATEYRNKENRLPFWESVQIEPKRVA